MKAAHLQVRWFSTPCLKYCVCVFLCACVGVYGFFVLIQHASGRIQRTLVKGLSQSLSRPLRQLHFLVSVDIHQSLWMALATSRMPPPTQTPRCSAHKTRLWRIFEPRGGGGSVRFQTYISHNIRCCSLPGKPFCACRSDVFRLTTPHAPRRSGWTFTCVSAPWSLERRGSRKC